MLFDKRIEEEKPEPRDEEDDIKLGQRYRAYREAKQLLNKILDNLAEYDTYKPKKSQFNKEV